MFVGMCRGVGYRGCASRGGLERALLLPTAMAMAMIGVDDTRCAAAVCHRDQGLQDCELEGEKQSFDLHVDRKYLILTVIVQNIDLNCIVMTKMLNVKFSRSKIIPSRR